MGERIGLLGGTFDRFHVGHHRLIEEVAARCDYLEIHMTSDSMASAKGNEVQSYNQRFESLSAHLEQTEFRLQSICWRTHSDLHHIEKIV